MNQSSQIVFSTTIAQTLATFLSSHQYARLVVLVDENTHKHCLPLIENVVANALLITIKSGEEQKTLATCTHIWQAMTDAQLDRKALMINLGGGVIGDMGGFCAATYKRGIDFIQIPTTLLSQVDASVGGKLGIDFMGLKNHIGVFQNPQAVLIDAVFLETLPANEVKSGFAEIIKHCLIADRNQWDKITTIPYNSLPWQELAKHSVQIKSNITEQDPMEKGLRKILNFGHTIGHAVESYLLPIADRKLLHGEAIAVGMIAESFLAYKKGFIAESDLKQVQKYILEIYGKQSITEHDIEQLLPFALQDKKNESNLIQSSLLESIGKANYNIQISLDEIRSALLYYMQL